MPQNKVTLGYRKRQEICCNFTGEEISSDGGIALLNHVENKYGLLSDFTNQLKDPRDPSRIKHDLLKIVKQRVFLMSLGYEDCNDSDELRNDPLISNLLDAEAGLASQPTLSRLENRSDKHVVFTLLDWWIDRYVSTIDPKRKQLIIDVDSTDDPTYGNQQLSMFHGYYDHKMYHILLFHDASTGQVILPFLRPGNTHTAKGFTSLLKRVIKKIRSAHADLEIVIRADSGFSGAKFYELANQLNLKFCVGIASNARLKEQIKEQQECVEEHYVKANIRHQSFVGPFSYKAKSWEKSEQMYAKVESTGKGINVRFIVSNMQQQGEELYKDFYVQRAEHSENRIKELKNMCFADRLSCSSFYANFFRLMLSTLSYELIRILKTCLKKSDDLQAQNWCVNSIRLYLFKIGAYIKIRVRRLTIFLSSAFPRKKLFHYIVMNV